MASEERRGGDAGGEGRKGLAPGWQLAFDFDRRTVRSAPHRRPLSLGQIAPSDPLLRALRRVAAQKPPL